MRRKMFGKLSGLVVSVMICLQAYGCGAMIVGGAAAGVTYVYAAGWVERSYTASIEQVYAASISAAEKMGMAVRSKSIAVNTAKIKAVKGGKEYFFKLEEKSKNATTLSIREDVLGNKRASQEIHETVAGLL